MNSASRPFLEGKFQIWIKAVKAVEQVLYIRCDLVVYNKNIVHIAKVSYDVVIT